MATQYAEEIKNDAVRYWKEHPELGIAKCAKNLGISKMALSSWRKIYDAKVGTVPTRGRGILRVMMQRNLHACVKSSVIHRMPEDLRCFRKRIPCMEKQPPFKPGEEKADKREER